MQREGFGIRLGAALLDAVIIFAVLFILGLITGGSVWAVMAGGGSQAGAEAVGIGFLILSMIAMIGYSLTEIFMAGTPGKRALGLIIADENGARAPTGQLATRWVVKNSGNLIRSLGAILGVGFLVSIGGLVGFVIVIGCFFVLAAPRQAFHDKAAKTAVFKREAIGAGPQGFPVMTASGINVSPPPPPPPPHA